MSIKSPTRTDAYTQCICGGTMSISLVETIPYNLDKMRHVFKCLECPETAFYEFPKKNILAKKRVPSKPK
jgi:hypothetical protein